MPAALVTIEEFRDFLGITGTAEDFVLQPILDGVEAWFVQECGRERVPFSAAQTARVEKQKGSGTHLLFLDYNIAALTSVVLGFDTAAPDKTLAVADKTVLIYEVGRNQLTRVDGGSFGGFGWPAYVHVTYNAQADLPRDAAVAVMRVGAALYRQRGSEDESTSTIGGQQITMAKVAEDDPVWQLAVANHRRAPV